MNFNEVILCDADEDMLSYLASLKVGDRSTIATECFNIADVHKLIKDPRVIQVELLELKFVQKTSYEAAISEKKKVCENLLKGVIDSKYSDFDEPVFQNIKWFDPQTWDQKQQETGQRTNFHEHFKEPLNHANFQLNFYLKEFKKFTNYVDANHKGKKAREIWQEFYKTRLSQYPNLAKIDELMMCFSSSKSSVERALNLLSKLLTDQRLTTNHGTLKINDKVFTESEKNRILVAAVKSFNGETQGEFF